jgi:TonB-linked SusC/RagA family outer membrane protein
MQIMAICCQGWRYVSLVPWRVSRILRIMRMVSFLLTILCLQLAAKTVSQTVSFSGKSVPLKVALTAMEKQTGYFVFYSDKSVLADSKPVSLTVKNMPVKAFLDELVKGQNIAYEIKGRTIIVRTERRIIKEEKILPPKQMMLRVTDQNGTPLFRASVTNKTTKFAGLTNEQGSISLQVSPGDELVVSYIGHETFTYTIKDTINYLPVRLKQSLNQLDEVIYTAYGKTSKRMATGDIVKVTGEEIQRQPVMNPLLALAGKVPGLLVSQTTGYASSPVKVLLRGQLNLNNSVNSEPLYVIDGAPLSVINASGSYLMGNQGYDQSDPLWTNTPTRGLSPLFSINPMDIESIEVLKDADAIAIYGAQGANGAILIKTKSGKPGPLQVDLSVRGGFTKAMRRIEYLGTPAYIEMRREAFKNDGVTPTAITAPELFLWDTTRNVNWQKELFGKAGARTDYDIAMSGGNQQFNFRASLGYGRVTDIATVSGASQRLILNTSTSYNSLNNKLRISLSVGWGKSIIDARTMPSEIMLPPNAPPIYDAAGKLNWLGWLQGQDARFPKIQFPFGILETSNQARSGNTSINVNLKYSILKGLNLTTNIGYNEYRTQSNNLTPIRSQNPLNAPRGSAGFTYSEGRNMSIEPLLNYVARLGSGTLDVKFGASIKSAMALRNAIYGSGYTNDDLINLIGAAASLRADNSRAEQKLAGLFTTLNYTLANKYIININARRDGSSRFGPGKRYGNFGSVGAAWIVSDEKWIKPLLPALISFFKLRGSYGIAGSDGVGDYQYISQWNPGTPPLYSYGGIAPMKNLHAVNPMFQWQEAKKLSVSLELGLMKEQQLTMNITYYRDRIGNQLVQFPIAWMTGFDKVTANSPALVQNAGWEMQLSARFINTSTFSWSGNFNISLNRNKLVAYPNLESSPYKTLYQVGRPLSIIPLLHYTGVDPLTGEMSYQDRNHDGLIRLDRGIAPGSAYDDRYWLDLSPRFYGGFATDLRYKSWSLNLLFSFRKANVDNPLWSFVKMNNYKNMPASVYDQVWKKPGDIAAYPRLMTMASYTSALFADSDGAYVQAFYMSCQNIALQYSISEKLTKKMRMKRCAISIQTQELFSIALSGQYRPGAPMFGLPIAKTITANLHVNF